MTGATRYPGVDDPGVLDAQLVRFLRWLAPPVLSFGLVEGVAFAYAGGEGKAVAAAALLLYGASLLLARSLLTTRGARRGAVGITSLGFLAAAVAVAVARPALLPAATLAPLLAVGVALPYASGRAAKVLALASWITTAVIAAFAEVLLPWSAAPASGAGMAAYDSVLRAASIATASAVALGLLLQYRGRLASVTTQVRAAEERALYGSTRDAQTGLPNLHSLEERLARVLGRARKDAGYVFALVFLDLDRFAEANDALGHASGDLLLAEAANRLSGRLLPTDTVARVGGDDAFVVLLEDLDDRKDARRIAVSILEALTEGPVRLPQDLDVPISASAGVLVPPPEAACYVRPKDLLADAERAVWGAKMSGGGRVEVFGGSARTGAVTAGAGTTPYEGRPREAELRLAVEREEFVLRYQPIVWLKSGRISGFEALLRWKHPTRGLLPPAEFLPLAEETGLIVPIGRRALRQACVAAARWRASFPNLQPPFVAVNLSPMQLVASGLIEDVRRALKDLGLEGPDLVVEVSEGAIASDARAVAVTLARLEREGVRVHVDNLGASRTSLGLLPQLPGLEALKIDRSLVGRIGEERGGTAQGVRAATALAHGMGLRATAVGVETPEQLSQLRAMGCDHAQGHLFGRPVDAGMVGAMLEASLTW